ncbi:MAG TPA: type IV secretion system protein [Candidatus Saccharimonadia bacterium]|nr:type IV secretion system protein [Candidatus Saccharimonadia bacterium]
MQQEPSFPAHSSATNGTVAPAPAEEWRKIEQAYAEIQRRDSSAEQRTWRAERLTLVLAGLLALTIGVGLWLYMHGRTVQAFVQLVQLDDTGRLVQLGIPQDLLSYTPSDGVWMDMITQWIRYVRWRSPDPTPTVAKTQWAWAYRHTCSDARRLLQTVEDKEKPFQPSKRLVAVEVKSITKTAAPESYQVLWTETSTDKTNPSVKTEMWSATFSVGRYRPPTLADTLENHLGLCVTAWDWSQTPQP